jgi:hypothetical protein
MLKTRQQSLLFISSSPEGFDMKPSGEERAA